MGEVLGNQVSETSAVEQMEREAALMDCLKKLQITVDARAPERLARYHHMLEDWNQRVNLTAEADFQASLQRHYADSLAPLAVEGAFPMGARVIDVGSGAGFPGLPLAVARPDLRVTLLDSLNKRVAFLSAVTEELGLTNVRLIHARAEDAGRAPDQRERYDLAIARAVAPLAVLCELLLPFVRPGGRILCYKGPSAAEELPAAARASTLLGGGRLAIIPVVLPEQPDWRHCVVTCEKRTPTPRLYPRKAGTPNREPLSTL